MTLTLWAVAAGLAGGLAVLVAIIIIDEKRRYQAWQRRQAMPRHPSAPRNPAPFQLVCGDCGWQSHAYTDAEDALIEYEAHVLTDLELRTWSTS